ncbi:MAG TPA: hypothetical protein VNT01_05355 [Symbiobacteriaceae bacterium]|nr:hypothetical protein [Symbiobacteriaceae bacterium]
MYITSAVISCTPVELAYLAALVNDGPLIGVPDPFSGRLAPEVEEALGGARAQLQHRGLIHIGTDGTVTADEELAALLSICIGSQPSFRLVRTLPGSGTTVHHYHQGEAGSVELAASADGQVVDIIAICNLAERIVQLLNIAQQAAPASAGGTVSEALLERVRDLAEEGRVEDGAMLLHRAGIPIEPAALLVSDLASPLRLAVLLAIHPSATGWGADGVTFVEGAGGLWLLKPAAGQVTVSLVGAREAESVIRQILGE